MLTRLSVRNLAVVADVTIEFGPRLNVISGETGAGKSLLMGALGLAVGDRANSTWVRTGSDSARVEAHFEPDDVDRVNALLTELGLDPMEDDWLSVRREVSADGKSRAFVAGSRVRLATLKAIGDLLVDRHGQGDQSRLESPIWQRDCLDVLAKADPQRRQLAESCDRERALTQEIDAIRARHEQIARERDFFEHQLREIDAAELTPDEDVTLRDEQRLFSQSSRLVETGEAAVNDLVDAEPSALGQLDSAARALEELAAIDAEFAPAVDMLTSARVEVEEVAAIVRSRLSALEFSAERRDEIERRLDLIGMLKRKYGRTVEQILSHGEELRSALKADADAETEAAEAVATREAVRTALGKGADALHRKRVKAAAQLSKSVQAVLPDLGMEGATFDVAIEPIADESGWHVRGGLRLHVGPTGADHVQFLLAANPGQTPQPLGEGASGGETSRLMLVLRVLLSEAARSDVQVLDEVDTGIGGSTARAVGAHIHRLADHRQVIAITHLAAVACHADHHHRIDKVVAKGETSIAIDTLDAKSRVVEIARMLSGGADDATAKRHARELLKQAQHA